MICLRKYANFNQRLCGAYLLTVKLGQMKKLFFFILLLLSTYGFSQTLPEIVITVSSQTTTTIGTQTTDGKIIDKCLLFKKQGNQITGFACNSSDDRKIVYQTSGVQEEKKTDDFYSITYFGYEYIFGDPVYSFLTYTYKFNIKKWAIFIENVYDNNTVGTFRCFTKYSNL